MLVWSGCLFWCQQPTRKHSTLCVTLCDGYKSYIMFKLPFCEKPICMRKFRIILPADQRNFNMPAHLIFHSSTTNVNNFHSDNNSNSSEFWCIKMFDWNDEHRALCTPKASIQLDRKRRCIPCPRSMHTWTNQCRKRKQTNNGQMHMSARACVWLCGRCTPTANSKCTLVAIRLQPAHRSQ